ncbi:ABC transporter substrate-binding protein [Mesorhizobium sp. M1329]|uniref:ABC transporter substrate-binding protein n=1 Tax=Mesorhizobium sp. M1329 TaxID=2957083 RepID=UPI00333C34C0
MSKWEKTAAGLLTRRQFNFGVGALAILAGTGLGVGRPAAQEPKKGGRLRVALPDASAADTIDPHKQVTLTDLSRCSILYEKLADFDTDGKLQPYLAESWEASPDAKVWHIKLRSGVEFHNGKTMSSADVVYSLNRVLDEKTASPARSQLASIESVKTDGDLGITITLKAANAELPYLLAVRALGIVPDGASDFPKDAIGTGAWKVADYQPGISAVFTRHDNYRINGQPYLDEIETFGVPDTTTRLNALLSGEVDVIQRLDPRVANKIKADASAQVLSVAGTAHISCPMRQNVEPYSNKDVVIALKHSFDRQRYIQQAFDGYGTVGRDNPVFPSDPAFDDTIPVPQHDPDKVRFHLKKAGHENTTFEMSAADVMQGGINAAVVLTELMRETGVNVTLRRVPSDGFWQSVWLKAPWCGSSWSGRPTALTMMEAAYESNAAFNETAWNNPTFDKLLVDARAQVDEVKRTEMIKEAQRMITDDCSTIIPVFVPFLDAVANNVKNFKGHPRGPIGAGHWQEVWLDS